MTATPCPGCGTTMTPTEQETLLRCLNPTCKIGVYDPVENRGMFKMPSPPSDRRWVTTGEGLTEMSELIPADAPLPEGYREGRS